MDGCRHVVLPPDIAKHLPKNRLLSEQEWRSLGVQQSRGWMHYAIHRPEPHIMLFRRPLNFQQQQQQPQADNARAANANADGGNGRAYNNRGAVPDGMNVGV
ncbi:hypothetical protein CBR_g2791 [Chara braunii]|uniref:Cyclin-dependent kinases regulatory subunit n=1 Tax=Chara braunii TaxID=69332 RepID=A0A388KDV6_CHABU|nr:hypothetical protein CBR_g2791 [Chara braunii]|eukprot:GBG68240.1 hypothetical protein CBR_g2791 [Chara braunii]